MLRIIFSIIVDAFYGNIFIDINSDILTKLVDAYSIGSLSY